MCWAFVILILLPQIVSAECAWILWEKTRIFYTTTSQENWKIIQTSKVASECQEGLAKIVKKYAAPDLKTALDKFEKNNASLRYVSTYDATGKAMSVVFIDLNCLPDTIDPRTPKH